MIDHVLTYTIPATYALLPDTMRSTRATAFLLSVGLQESGFTVRRQYNKGPAHSFWQWEYPTVKAVWIHPASHAAVEGLITALCYHSPNASDARQARELHEAMTHNDTLACGLSRCLLWTLPAALPGPTDVSTAFFQYLQAWNPGAYKRGTEAERLKLRATWNHNYAEAWGRVQAAGATVQADGSS